MTASVTARVPRTRHEEDASHPSPDDVAVEEPLEIRVGNVPVAVLLRTPGRDEDLAVGFALTEGVLSRAADVDQVRPCANVPPQAAGNVVDVMPAPGVIPDLGRFARPRHSNSACGVCGAASLDQLLSLHGTVDDARTLPADLVRASTRLLRQQQHAFALTGGLHAAGLLDDAGGLSCAREDVGRHNAADKALGAWALQHGDAPARALVMSSRAGFEIVQKAHARRVPVVITVGAPTSMAVAHAVRAGITLVAFARESTFSVYAHPHRVG